MGLQGAALVDVLVSLADGVGVDVPMLRAVAAMLPALAQLARLAPAAAPGVLSRWRVVCSFVS